MTTPTQSLQFPHHIKISLEIDIIVDKQEDQDYYIDVNANPTIDYIADVYDYLFEGGNPPYSINNLTKDKIREALNKQAGIVP